MEREQIIKALECCSLLYEDRDCTVCPKSTSKVCTVEVMRDALSLIKELTKENENWKAIAEGYQKQFEDCAEDRARLTEENERLKGVGIPDNETYIKLSDAKHAIMNYIGEQTVSKYASSAECKAARGGAEGAMNELDYIPPANVAPKADTVRKMHSMLCEGRVSNDNVVIVANQVAKEMLEGT